jgi:hypothetical protein
MVQYEWTGYNCNSQLGPRTKEDTVISPHGMAWAWIDFKVGGICCGAHAARKAW